MNNSRFDCGLLELFFNHLGCFLLTLVTFGIAYPWAACHINRLMAMHTVIDGHRLTFDGKAMQLFGNWIKWLLLCIITLGIYGFWVNLKMKQWVTYHTHME